MMFNSLFLCIFKRFGPEEHIFEVGSKPLIAMSFSQFFGEIQGSVVCLEPCKMLTISLRSAKGTHSLAPRSTASNNQGKFTFKQVVPGDYLMTVDKEEWCWKEKTLSVSVNTKVVSAKFEQKGFRLTINASHRTVLSYTTDAGLKGSISVDEGTSRECVSSPGMYSFVPSGCHKFGTSARTWNTSAPQLLSLIASHHKVSGTLVSNEPGPFYINVKHASTGMEIKLGPLAEPGTTSPGVYNFEHWLAPGDIATFTPWSSSNLFQYDPTSYQLKMEDICLPDFVQFKVERALFIKGLINPAIKGVTIKVYIKKEDSESQDEKQVLQYSTNVEGKFIAGPLDKSLSYTVVAEKLGYMISPELHEIKPVSTSAGATKDAPSPSEVAKVSFDVYKLAEINVKIMDGGTNLPLSGVLVSTSGGKDYRQNSLTEADGTFAFMALMPGDYFVRPMMKEYTFNPASKMVKVEGGATVNVEIR